MTNRRRIEVEADLRVDLDASARMSVRATGDRLVVDVDTMRGALRVLRFVRVTAGREGLARLVEAARDIGLTVDLALRGRRVGHLGRPSTSGRGNLFTGLPNVRVKILQLALAASRVRSAL